MGNIAQIYNKSNSCENALLFPTYTDNKTFLEYIVDRAQGPTNFKTQIATTLLELRWGTPGKKIYTWKQSNPVHILTNLNNFVNMIDTFSTPEHKQIACNYLCEDIIKFCKIEQAKDFMGRNEITLSPRTNAFKERFHSVYQIKHPDIIRKEMENKEMEKKRKKQEKEIEKKRKEIEKKRKEKKKKFNIVCMRWFTRSQQIINECAHIPPKNKIEQGSEIYKVMIKLIDYFLGLAEKYETRLFKHLFMVIKYCCMLLFYFMDSNNISRVLIQQELCDYITENFETYYNALPQTHPYSLVMHIFYEYRKYHTMYDDVKEDTSGTQLWPLGEHFVDITEATAYQVKEQKWTCVGKYLFVKHKVEDFSGSFHKYGLKWNYISIWNEDKRKIEIEFIDDNGDSQPSEEIYVALNMHLNHIQTSLAIDRKVVLDLYENDWYSSDLEYLYQLQQVNEHHRGNTS